MLLEQVDNGEEDWIDDDWNGQPFWNYKWELKLKSNGSVIIHPVKERVFTEDDMTLAFAAGLIKGQKYNELPTSRVFYKEWFNKHYSQ